jgi:hypothetical protein
VLVLVLVLDPSASFQSFSATTIKARRRRARGDEDGTSAIPSTVEERLTTAFDILWKK